MDFGSLQTSQITLSHQWEFTHHPRGEFSSDAKFESSDKVPMTISYSFGASGRCIEVLEPSSIVYVDSGANLNFVNRLVRVTYERRSPTT
jgi:hypothetical protein